MKHIVFVLPIQSILLNIIGQQIAFLLYAHKICFHHLHAYKFKVDDVCDFKVVSSCKLLTFAFTEIRYLTVWLSKCVSYTIPWLSISEAIWSILYCNDSTSPLLNGFIYIDGLAHNCSNYNLALIRRKIYKTRHNIAIGIMPLKGIIWAGKIIYTSGHDSNSYVMSSFVYLINGLVQDYSYCSFVLNHRYIWIHLIVAK